MKSNAKHCVLWFVAAAVLANVAWAGDVWKDKKPADWSQKEMEKFLTRSPWARTVQPATTPPSMDQGPTSANTGGWGGGPGGGGGGGGGWHGNTSGMDNTQITTFQIRWVSAPIMRAALKLAESEPVNAAIARYASDYYIISVTMQTKGGGGGGAWGGGGRWGAPRSVQGSATQAQQEESRKRFEAMLTQGAVLRFGHHAVHPAQAQMVPGKDGMTTLYLFPRALQLEDASKDFVFEFAQGPAVTQANFSLKGFEQAPEKGL